MPNFFVIFYNNGSQSYDFIKGNNSDLSFTAVDGADANGLAAIASGRTGKFVAMPLAGANAASYRTSTGVANADLLWTADDPGTNGNNLRVRYVVSGNNTALSVSISGNDITVNVATNGSGAATSTATQVMNAANAHPTVSTLVTVSLASGNDGTGVVTALDWHNLQFGISAGAVATITEIIQVADSAPTTI